MSAPIDITGQRFGRLVAVRFSGNKRGSCRVWTLLCDCGNESESILPDLFWGRKKSCGCLRRECASKRSLSAISFLETHSRLSIICRMGRDRRQQQMVQCMCSCGNVMTCSLKHLRNGNTKSCGCWKREVTSIRSRTHGLSQSSEYKIWTAMKKRCLNENCKDFPDYGGRGITVCDAWAESFSKFFEDMGPRPTGRSLDRENNDLGYSKDNCRWATGEEQATNRRPRKRKGRIN